MCCDLSTDEWRCLIPADSDCVDIGDDGDGKDNEDEASPTSSRPTHNPTGHHLTSSPIPQSRSKRTSDDTPARREEDAHERRMADISSVKRREAKVQGHAYLGEEELQRELAQLLRNI